MDMKVFVGICALLGAVSCQYDTQHVIDQTQYLQQIEKYGTKNIYPQLNNVSNTHDANYHQGSAGVRNNTGSSQRVQQQPTFNSTERFLNKTKTSMSPGVCVKEVPTASLLKPNQHLVPGNGSDSSLSRVQVCCEGYQRNIYNFRKCDPVCKEECVHGFCAAPNTCVCYPDHVRNLGGFCLPTCPIMCGNGLCNSDNTCTCNDGFYLEPNGKFCIPKCSKGCNNGNCTAPEECTCDSGFSLSVNGKCEPVCSKGCKNGDCVSTEVCKCHRGYSMVNDVCEPICERGCSNGVCVAPETCECSGNGWSLDPYGTKCVASCDRACLNGVCSGPNQCTCRSGYVADSFDLFKCVPNCDPPCVNGVCSGPNMCLCHAGYVKDRSVKGSQKCVR